MPCFLGCAAVFFPRLVFILLILFSDYIGNALAAAHPQWWLILEILGFIFLPLSTLAYAFALHNGGVAGLNLALLIIAVLIDLGLIGGGATQSRTVIVKRKTVRD